FGSRIEVTGFTPESEVRNKPCSACDVFAQMRKLLRQQYEPATQRHDNEDDDQCGEDSLAPARVEIGEAERVLLEVPADDRSDQEPGNHKEDVDTNVAAAERGDARMKANDRENG